MKIYFAGSIRGGRDMQKTYHHIISKLKQYNYEVLSEHVGNTNLESEKQLSDIEIYNRDMKWIRESDVVIADVTLPSLGVGYEIASAYHYFNKPVLCIAHIRSNVSAMISGSQKLLHYNNDEHAEITVLHWLKDQETNLLKNDIPYTMSSEHYEEIVQKLPEPYRSQLLYGKFSSQDEEEMEDDSNDVWRVCPHCHARIEYQRLNRERGWQCQVCKKWSTETLFSDD